MSRLDKLLKMLETDPADPFVLYGIAQEHSKAGRHADAITYFDRCIAADAGHAYAYYHKAVAQRDLGDDAAAIVTLRRGIDAASRSKDSKAKGELEGLLDTLE